MAYMKYKYKECKFVPYHTHPSLQYLDLALVTSNNCLQYTLLLSSPRYR